MIRAYVNGVDLTAKNPSIVQVAFCIKARYDSGIINHNADNTGVIEIWKLSK